MTLEIKDEFNPDQILIGLFDFYKKSGLNADSADKDFVTAAKTFVHSIDQKDKDKIALDGFGLHPDMFSIEPADAIDPFELFLGFRVFFKKVYAAITKDKPEVTGVKGVVRRRLPELAAFDMVGNNDLQISSSPANYTLVYSF